jgi:hypothetical protein
MLADDLAKFLWNLWEGALIRIAWIEQIRSLMTPVFC